MALEIPVILSEIPSPGAQEGEIHRSEQLRSDLIKNKEKCK